MTKAIGFSTNYLQVNPIIIKDEEVRLLWGIPLDTVINDMKLGLFVNLAGAQSNSLSSFDIGFSVSSYSPIEGKYQVVVYVGATSVLE